MGKSLVLAEKPSVARDIAKVLNCDKKGNGFIEGKDYVVTWALGHLVTLADPEEYNKKYQNWNIEDLPIIPDRPKLVTIKNTSKQYNAVKSQMLRKDVDSIIIATDAGREGELVARWIIEKANINKKIKRLWISSVTDKAIKEGFNNLKDGNKYENLYKSAKARSYADWIVGINATRALTVKYNAQLSCGRVQTPTLEIIRKREEEIRDFKAKDYYGILVKTREFNLVWENDRCFDEDLIDRKIKSLKSKKLEIVDINKKNKKIYSKHLYDLTELQRDANKMFGFSPKETLSIMQNLYERHKLLTYPRTDSRFLGEDLLDTLEARLKAVSVGSYNKFARNIVKNGIKKSKLYIDDSKVRDHHAIIPTEEYVNLEKLSNREIKIYDLVVKRFLSVLYTPFEYEEVIVRAKIGEEIFKARGKNILKLGWKEIFNGKDEDLEEDSLIKDQILPNINNDYIFENVKIEKIYGKTNPPPYFNEASLLSAMENPGIYIFDENKRLKEIVNSSGGIGTVATRADIIEKLFNSFLIENRGKDLILTNKARQLLDLVPKDLKSPKLTAQWEENLSKIEDGKIKDSEFINEMKIYSKKIVDEIKKSEDKFKHDNLSKTKCPECNKYMLEVKSKKGKMYVCQDRECRGKINISQSTNARCPNCKKKLELKGQGEGRIFTCICGYREKFSSFEKRKKQKKNRINKKDINKYLINQNKEEALDNSLAEALKNLKL